jgi:hypothetical protein
VGRYFFAISCDDIAAVGPASISVCRSRRTPRHLAAPSNAASDSADLRLPQKRLIAFFNAFYAFSPANPRSLCFSLTFFIGNYLLMQELPLSSPTYSPLLLTYSPLLLTYSPLLLPLLSYFLSSPTSSPLLLTLLSFLLTLLSYLLSSPTFSPLAGAVVCGVAVRPRSRVDSGSRTRAPSTCYRHVGPQD